MSHQLDREGDFPNRHPTVALKIPTDKWEETQKDGYEKTILLFVTGNCNLRCSYCFNSENLGESGKGMWLDFVKRIVEANPDVDKYDIQWGEPLLHKETNDIIRYLNSQWKKVGIYTNGYLLKRLDKDHRDLKVGISFQSIVSLDKSLKPISDIKNALIEYQSIYDFKIVYLINRHNISGLKMFLRYVEANFPAFTKVTVWLVRNESDYWSDSADYVLPFSEYAETIQDLIDTYDWSLDIDIFSKGVLRSAKLPESRPWQLNRFKNVFFDGTFVPCLYLIAKNEKEPIPADFSIPFPDCDACSRTWRTNCLADKIYLRNLSGKSGKITETVPFSNVVKPRKYTVMVIKKDAIARWLTEDILVDLSEDFDIVSRTEKHIGPETVARLKEFEWKNNWKPYPDESVRQFSYVYESGTVLALLCRAKNDEDAVSLGKKRKWNHHLAYLCSPSTIRGKYHDVADIPRIETDELAISYLCDESWNRISSVPNVIHAVDNDLEFSQHMETFFPDFGNLLDA